MSWGACILRQGHLPAAEGVLNFVPHHGPMASNWIPPTRDGRSTGKDPSSGLAWSIEPPDAHWAEHDARLVTYWRSRPASERLAQASAYRVRVHGLVVAPDRWTWQFVPVDHAR